MKERVYIPNLNCYFSPIIALALAMIFLLAQNAPGATQVIQALPFYDSFDYNAGAGLAGASSTVWETCYPTANVSLTTNTLSLVGYVPSAGNAITGKSQAFRFGGTQFTAQTNTAGNTVYVSFLYQVNAYPVTTPGVIAFLDSTNIGTSQNAVLPTKAGLALLIDHTGHIGINADSTTNTGAQFESAATALNTTVLIVARYTFHPTGNDAVDLWVNPSSTTYGAASAPTSDATVTCTYNLSYIANFTFSCNGNLSTFGQTWDEARIGTNWSQVVPSSNPSGPVSAAHSLLAGASTNTIVASGTNTSIITMQARDINGLNETSGGSTVLFSTTAGTISGTTDNGNGSYQATLTSPSTLGTATVTAKLGGTSIATSGTATNSASVAVKFIAGPVSASASTAVANPTTVAADGESISTITITAMDSFGHVLTNQPVTLSVTGSGNTVSTPANTGANGQTTATITSTVGQTDTVTVTIGGTQINEQPTVTFTAQGVSAVRSTAVASPNTGLTADGVTTSTITVTALDGNGDPLSGQAVTLAATGSGNTLTQPSATTDVNGEATGTLVSTVAGTKTITVNIAGTTINAQPTVTFVAGAATHIAFTSEPVTTPVGVTMPGVVVQIEDQEGNPVPQSGATVTLALSGSTLSGTDPQVTDATGKATFNDLSIQPISYGLYLTATVLGFSPVQSSVFNTPPLTFYKVSNNSAALNSPASWTAIEGGTGPAGPPGTTGIGEWDTNSGGGTVDIGGSASWYGMVIGANGSLTITDTNGGSVLTLGAGGFDGSAAQHTTILSNGWALATDQTWKWTSKSYSVTFTGTINNNGHLLTIYGYNASSPEQFNGPISGNGGLTLLTNGDVTLNGANTYMGNTTVNGGKLIISTNGSIANSADIVLGSNTTFDVSAVTPFVFSSGQTISGSTTGSGTATISASTSSGPGNVILASGAQAAFTVAGNVTNTGVTAGQIRVVGGVTLNGNAISVNVTSAPLPQGTYTLMTATNGFTVNGAMPTPTITGLGLANGAFPQLVVNGTNLQLVADFGVSPVDATNNCGDTAIFTATPELYATNYQWYNPGLQPIPGATNTTLILPDTHPADSGTYQIVASGPNGTLTNFAVLVTVDSAPPTITLNGSGTVPLKLGDTYTELGATAYDACVASNLPVTITGTVNTGAAGEYDITYSAVSDTGVTGTVTRAVVVIDPTVTVAPTTLNLDFGAGTDANQNYPITPPSGWSLLAFGDLNQSPNIWGSPSFPNPDGKNPGLTLSFGNISGWSIASTEAGADNSGAVVGISTNGFFNYGSKGSGVPGTFTLTGVPAGECVSIYAVDAWNGASYAPVIVYGGQTNTVIAASFDTTPAIGEFQYVGTAIATNGTVSGSWTGPGGPLTEGQIGGMIIQVQSVPLNNLSIAPLSTATQCGSNVTFTATVYGLPPTTYQWYDNNTNAIPGATNASYTLVDPQDGSVGNYTVVAQNAYNSLTNVATITAVLHTAPPVMTLNGASTVNLQLNDPYTDAGLTAFDLCAQTNLTVITNSTVNTSAVGTYTVTYYAITADGTPGTVIRTVNVSTNPVFGPNVLIFDPTMTNIQSQLNSVFSQMQYNQFGTQRYALMFKPGSYNELDVDVGFYTQVLGLGLMPDATVISGYLHSDAVLPDNNGTENFWRSAENFAIDPTNGNYIIWAVSQGTALRRMHVAGTLDLADFGGENYTSGGFMSDSRVDNSMTPISQQQWLSRNDVWGSWNGGVWNMVFVGVSNTPTGIWPTNAYTIITNTPIIREKPYLYLDTNGNYNVFVPALETNSLGISWGSGPTPGVSLPINQFYIASSPADNAASINAALNAGLNIILTPGVYLLNGSIKVTRPDTIILGLGYPTLVPQTGCPAIVVSDVDGVEIGGLLCDAGPVETSTLLEVGPTNSCLDHSADPIFLSDISMRVGGATPGMTASCLNINANDVVGDNIWLWRADHGNGVGWTNNVSENGLIVNGNRVTMYGLFNEHHEQYQTLWNGNWGRLYMYQSELPYDPPSQAAWSHDGVEGYASYKVADTVTSHQAYGLGIYAVFINCTNISCLDAIEAPTNSEQVNFHDMIAVYIEGEVSDGGTSALYSIINGMSGPKLPLYGPNLGTATANYLWQYPTFSIGAGVSGNNAAISFPTESWHSYQIQYKTNLTDPTWSNLGGLINGNDTLQTLMDSTPGTNRFYQILYY